MKKLLSLVAMGLMLMSISAYAADDAAKATEEVAPAAEQAVVAPIEGYLSDVLCGTAGKDAAGVDLTVTPEKHTVACLTMPDCEKSGYGVFVWDEAAQKYAFKAFNAEATELVKTEVLAKTEKTEGIYVEVTGVEKDGVITVETIIESEDEDDADAAKEGAVTEEPKTEDAAKEEPKTEEKK